MQSHRQKALELLKERDETNLSLHEKRDELLAEAQVHATLALSAGWPIIRAKESLTAEGAERLKAQWLAANEKGGPTVVGEGVEIYPSTEIMVRDVSGREPEYAPPQWLAAAVGLLIFVICVGIMVGLGVAVGNFLSWLL